MTNKTPSSSNTELPDGMKFDDLTALAEPNEVDMQIKSIDDLATEIAEYLDEVITDINRKGVAHEMLPEEWEEAKRWFSIAKTDFQKGFMALRRCITRPRQF